MTIQYKICLRGPRYDANTINIGRKRRGRRKQEEAEKDRKDKKGQEKTGRDRKRQEATS